jgi:biotin/methionine sulfoxide reductase
VVRVFNDRGATLAGLRVSDAIRPGVVAMATGAWWDPAGDGLDRHGNPNVLTADIGTSRLGQGCAAQSCLVQVEAFTDVLPALTITEPPARLAESLA